MGLNDSYESIKGQIILISPIPSLDKTFSMILQDERQRQAQTLVLPIAEPSAFAVVNNQPKRREKPKVTFQHCGKVGHIREKCYRLIGFPPNFKFTKSKLDYSSSNNSSLTHSANQVLSQGSQGQHNWPIQGPQLSFI